MRIEIIHIGDELLIGETDPYPKELIWITKEKGATINIVSVVGDDYSGIMRLIESANNADVDILVLTGGLGPTSDDITRNVVADFLGTELVVVPEAVDWFKDSIKRLHGIDMEMKEGLYKMTMIPRGSRALKNITGAACGIEGEKNGMRLFCLPGFPKEMLPMYKEYVLPKIEREEIHESEVVAFLPECFLEPVFQKVIRGYDIRIASRPSERWMEKGTRAIIKGEDKEEVEKATAYLEQLIHELEIEYEREG
jgi:nicotinamide-nucleotide amidase